MPENGISGLQSTCAYSILADASKMAFQSSCVKFDSHQRCINVLISPHPRQHLIWNHTVLGFWMSIYWYQLLILISFPWVAKASKRVCIYLSDTCILFSLLFLLDSLPFKKSMWKGCYPCCIFENWMCHKGLVQLCEWKHSQRILWFITNWLFALCEVKGQYSPLIFLWIYN